MNSPSPKSGRLPPTRRHRFATRGVVMASGIGVYLLFQWYLRGAMGLPAYPPPAPDRSPALMAMEIEGPIPQRKEPSNPLYAQATLTAIPLHTNELFDAMSTSGLQIASFHPEVPEGLEDAVRFWELVYGRYDSNKILFHDPHDLSKIYSVLDINPSIKTTMGDIEKDRIRKRLVDQEMERLATTVPGALIRTQTGLKDRFARAVSISGRYLGEMERIFESYGLPWQLTRMVFVESMFELEARSHAGAVGPWQFMKQTARRYLTVNNYIDERYDPFLSTHAAAGLLLENYRELKSWPLAINAYNSGRGRLAHAVSELKTRDIATIIHQYKHPNYAFASRNFYPEFLAAFRVEQNAHRTFGQIRRMVPLAFDVVTLPKGVRLADLAREAQVPVETLFTYNPALARSWWRDVRPLPNGSRVRVPRGLGSQIERSLATR